MTARNCNLGSRCVRILLAVAFLFSSPSVLPGASPQEIRQKVGIYLWGRTRDLAIAVSDAKRLGADQVVRTFIGPWSDTPPYQDDLRSLREKAASPGYQTVFHDFHVIMLTAYDSFSYAKTYGPAFRARNKSQHGAPGRAAEVVRHHPSHPSSQLSKNIALMKPAEAEMFLQGVREEFRNFSLELSKLDRTFILSNWEAENDVPDAKYWPWFTRYLQARIDGIMAGRQEARQRGYPAQVLIAFEFTIVPGFKGRPSGLVEIAGKLHGLDILSYSSWWSIGWDLDAAAIERSFRYAIELIRGYARQAGLPQRIVIGEFGEYWNLHPSADRLKAIIDASSESGVEYLFNWVLYEQPGEKDEWGRNASHVGKFFLDRTLTPQGKAFQKWFTE